MLLQIANELPKALSTLRYRGDEGAIELAMKQELPIVGIEANDIGRQHIDGEIRRELRNVSAVMLCNLVSVIACHEVSTRTFAAALGRQCKSYPPAASTRSSSSRAGVSDAGVSR